MADDRHRLGQFKLAYQNDGQSGYVLSSGSVADMNKFTVHKRAVSSKKSRGSKTSKKLKANGPAVRNQGPESSLQPSNLRHLYQKLPTGGTVQSYTTQTSQVYTPQTSKEQSYAALAQQRAENGKAMRKMLNGQM